MTTHLAPRAWLVVCLAIPTLDEHGHLLEADDGGWFPKFQYFDIQRSMPKTWVRAGTTFNAIVRVGIGESFEEARDVIFDWLRGQGNYFRELADTLEAESWS